jgi:hypothetical protein
MDEGSTPYAPYENIERVFKRVRTHGWPPRVNAEYLDQLSIGDGLAPRVLQALKFLGVIGADGSPTDNGEFLHLASESEWPLVLQGLLRTSYAGIFRVVNPETSPRQTVRDAFRPMLPKGQQDRMTSLFLGLCALAGMDVQDRPTQRPGQGQPRKADRGATQKDRNSRAGAEREPIRVHHIQSQAGSLTTRIHAGPLHPSLAGILQAVPELDSIEDLDRWIESFRATFVMVKRLDKIDKTPAEAEALDLGEVSNR